MYKLDSPRTDTATLDDIFLVLRDVAGRATLSQAAVDRERGIILSERAMRESPIRRAIGAQLNTISTDDRIGATITPDDNLIRTVAPATIRSFYDRYYRPERATLVVVGDVDPAAIEARIKAQFSDWTGRGPAGGPAAIGGVVAADAAPRVAIVADPALSDQIVFLAARPLTVTPASSQTEARDTLVRIADTIMGRRFAAIAARPDAPIVAGLSMSMMPEADFARRSLLGVVAKPGKAREATQLLEQEYRRARDHGFTAGEVADAVTRVDAALVNAVANTDTRPSAALADQILGTLPTQDIVMAPAATKALFDRIRPALVPANVNAVFRAIWPAPRPHLFVGSRAPVETATVNGWLDEAAKVAVAAPVDAAAQSFAYTNFGMPGRIVSDTVIPDLGIRTIRFANNVRLNLKRTDFDAGAVMTQLRFGSGIAGLKADRPGPVAFAAIAMNNMGLVKHSATELETIFAGQQVARGFSPEEGAFIVGGKTVPRDLDAQLRYYAALLSAPGFRSEADAQWQGLIPLIDTQLGASAAGVLTRESSALVFTRDPRMRFGGIDDWKAQSTATMKAQLADDFATGPVEIGIVGAIDEAATIKAVAATLGALPRRAAAPSFISPVSVAAPAPGITRLVHQGPAEQAAVVASWPISDGRDRRRGAMFDLLAAVAKIEVLDELRERTGASYAPSVKAEQSTVFANNGAFTISTQSDPTKADAALAAIDAIVNQLRTRPVSAAVLDRARTPMLEAIGQRDRSNAEWLGAVATAQSDPQKLTAWRNRRAWLTAITPADLMALAKAELGRTPARATILSSKAK